MGFTMEYRIFVTLLVIACLLNQVELFTDIKKKFIHGALHRSRRDTEPFVGRRNALNYFRDTFRDIMRNRNRRGRYEENDWHENRLDNERFEGFESDGYRGYESDRYEGFGISRRSRVHRRRHNDIYDEIYEDR